MSHDVVVIGAGVSGLACAHDLARQGFDVQVLERQVRTGGNAKSLRINGFLMELGPTTFNATFSTAMQQIRDLGLDVLARELGPDVRKRYLRDKRGLHGIPVHPFGIFTSGYLSPFDRLSMAAEIIRPRRYSESEETIHQFATRRFGRGFADKVIEPLAAGIFMGDSETLSINPTFSKLVELERRSGSIIRGILAAKRGREPGRKLMSWDCGIGTLPQTLTTLLRERILTGVTVTKVTRKSTGFEISTANSGTLRSRAVVMAVQPHVAADLLDRLDPPAATAAGDIAAPPISVVYLGYRKKQVDHPLDGLGFLSTKNNGGIISGAQFSSTMFNGRAPAEHVSVSCYIGGARQPELTCLPEIDLIDIVDQELSDLLGIKGSPVIGRTHRWPRGLPHYTFGHESRQTVMASTNQRVPGLFVTGNFLQGVSVSNCLETASATAKKVQAELEGIHTSDNCFDASSEG